jgi:hypothetical protein
MIYIRFSQEISVFHKIIAKIFGYVKNVFYICRSFLNLMGSDGVGYFTVNENTPTLIFSLKILLVAT